MRATGAASDRSPTGRGRSSGFARGTGDRTGAIQAALDEAADRAGGGGVVLLPSGLLRVAGKLVIRKSGVVLRGAGTKKTRLLFTGSSGLNGLVIDDGFRAAHGMQKYWKFAAGKWRALFRREVTGIDRKRRRVTLDIPLRYPLLVEHQASLRKESGYLVGVGIEDLSVSNAIDFEQAWKATRVHAIELRDCLDSWVRRVASFAGEIKGVDTRGRHLQSGGIRVRSSARITISDCHLQRPQHRGGGGNGYLFELSQSGEVLTVDCTAREGRHNFIANWDMGTSGCVWLRCHSAKGWAVFVRLGELGIVGLSEFHHALAMACLIDSCRLDDGWKAANRLHESSGAGSGADETPFQEGSSPAQQSIESSSGLPDCLAYKKSCMR